MVTTLFHFALRTLDVLQQRDCTMLYELALKHMYQDHAVARAIDL